MLFNYRSLSDKQLEDLIKHIPRHPLLAGQEGIRISLAGAQEKLALFYKDPVFYIPLNGAPSNYILKPGMAHFQSSIQNEYFCMMLAGDLGLNVPPVSIVRKGTQEVLLIKRFDRTTGNRRIHMHTFGNIIQANFRIPCTDYADVFKVTQVLFHCSKITFGSIATAS